MIIIPISEMSKLRLRGLGREDFSVPRLSMNFGLYAQDGEKSLPWREVSGAVEEEQQRQDDRG